MPEGIIGVARTDSREELAGIYSSADIYATPSIEETFGMTVTEANACGTFVVVIEGTACMEAVRPQMFVALPKDVPFVESFLDVLPFLEKRCRGENVR